MAELGELLEQAVDEADGLAREAARAQETVDRLLQLAASLLAAVESGGAETRARLEQLSVRLGEAEGELTQEGATARGALQLVQSNSVDLRERVLAFLGEARSDLASLRAERDELRAEVEQRGEQTAAGIDRSAARVQELEAAAEARLVQARQEIAAFRGLVDDARGAVAARRENLLAQVRFLEDAARARLAYVLQTYDVLAEHVRHQVGELQATLKSLSEQVAAGVTRRLGQDAVEALRAAAEPLKDAIHALDTFSRRTRVDCDQRVATITNRVEDVTGQLDRVRVPLDLVKQYLR